MATPTPSPIPTIYHILFTYIDPIFCLFGFYMHAFTPDVALAGYTPHATPLQSAPLAYTSTIPLLLDNLAGFFLVLGVLEASLLRLKPNDVVVWRCVQGCVFLLDVMMVYTHSKALSIEGRWDVGGWRGDDWRNIVGNMCAGLARLCCAFGVGFAGTTRPKVA